MCQYHARHLNKIVYWLGLYHSVIQELCTTSSLNLNRGYNSIQFYMAKSRMKLPGVHFSSILQSISMKNLFTSAPACTKHSMRTSFGQTASGQLQVVSSTGDERTTKTIIVQEQWWQFKNKLVKTGFQRTGSGNNNNNKKKKACLTKMLNKQWVYYLNYVLPTPWTAIS